MPLKNNIFGYVLLSIYLPIGLCLSDMPIKVPTLVQSTYSFSHQHVDFADIHHKHRFHVGILHLLGHLMETIKESNNVGKNHVIIAPKLLEKEVITHPKTISFHTNNESLLVFNTNADLLTAPVDSHDRLIDILKDLNIPLRAPPIRI